MQIENIKAQAREEIAKLMPLADAATRESAVSVYIAGAAYIAGESADNESVSRCFAVDYCLLADELRNLMRARVANAG